MLPFVEALAHVKPPELKCFYKCVVAGDRAEVIGGQDSHLIRPLTEANAWGVTVDGDDEVDLYPLQP